MNAISALKEILLREGYVAAEHEDALDRIVEEWSKRWVLYADNMVRVPTRKIEEGTPVERRTKLNSIAQRMKDTIFTAVGRDPSLLFYAATPVGDLLEFRLGFGVLRPSPVEPYAEAPPAAGNGVPERSSEPGQGSEG